MDPFSRAVDDILTALARKQQVEEVTARLKRLGARAVPRLLHHLDQGPRPTRTLVFYALQSCWSAAAWRAVLPYLAADDAELRRMAAIVLVKAEGYERLIAGLRPLLDHPSREVVAFALEFVEAEEPDPDRLLAHLADPFFHPALARHLPRHHDPRLTPATLALARAGNPATLPPAVAGLIYQRAADGDTREAMGRLLADADPAARELAGEYLTWLGSPRELSLIEQALAREEDSHAAASLHAARRTIHRRGERKTLAPVEEDGFAWGAWEPVWAYRGREPPVSLARREEAKRAWLARHLGLPLAGDSAAADPALCRGALLPPVRDYFDPDRRTFGHEVEKTAVKGFGGMVHVGDDLHWHAPHRTVVAIGPGRVRLAASLPTWGYLVVVEHRMAGDLAFCSLYAHLSPFLAVAPGDVVARGDKIGVIGRAYTWENGGYEAHLHFGIHWGPFHHIPRAGVRVDVRYQGQLGRGRVVAANETWTVVEIADLFARRRVRKPTSWTVGYLSREGWEEGGDGWEDPQAFLRSFS